MSPATHLIAAGTAASTTGLEPPGNQEGILNHESREWDERDARQGRSESGGEAGIPNHETGNLRNRIFNQESRNIGIYNLFASPVFLAS